MSLNGKDKKTDKKVSIGGQAVIEGVMMRGKTSMATAVRDADGVIRIESQRLKPTEKRCGFFKLPIIRGVVSFIQSLVGGSKTLQRPEDCAALDRLIGKATAEISRTAKINSRLVEYIEETMKQGGDAWADYERVVEDYGQLEALAQADANKAVKDIVKFDKKANGKSFLNILMCKFKKSKAQEKSNENQGPSVQ